jgi:hypothetical protein
MGAYNKTSRGDIWSELGGFDIPYYDSGYAGSIHARLARGTHIQIVAQCQYCDAQYRV